MTKSLKNNKRLVVKLRILNNNTSSRIYQPIILQVISSVYFTHTRTHTQTAIQFHFYLIRTCRLICCWYGQHLGSWQQCNNSPSMQLDRVNLNLSSRNRKSKWLIFHHPLVQHGMLMWRICNDRPIDILRLPSSQSCGFLHQPLQLVALYFSFSRLFVSMQKSKTNKSLLISC